MIRQIDVSIVIDTEDELYTRLEAEAERRGCTVDEVVGSLIYIGSYWLLDERLKLLEELRKND